MTDESLKELFGSQGRSWGGASVAAAPGSRAQCGGKMNILNKKKNNLRAQ